MFKVNTILKFVLIIVLAAIFAIFSGSWYISGFNFLNKIPTDNKSPEIQEQLEKDLSKLSKRDFEKELANYTLTHLPKAHVDNFEKFFSQNAFTQEQKNAVALLYFYPHGYIMPPDNKFSMQYLQIMLQPYYNWHQLLNDTYSNLNFDNVTHKILTYDMSLTFPKEWRLVKFSQNVFGVVNPESNFSYSRPYDMKDIAFDIFVFKEPNPKNTKSQVVFNSSRDAGHKLISQEKNITWGPWNNVEKYVWKVDNKNFIEDYLLDIDGVYYKITFKYAPGMDIKHRQQAEKIAFSLTTNNKSIPQEEKSFSSLSETQFAMFYSKYGALSLYLGSLKGGKENTFR